MVEIAAKSRLLPSIYDASPLQKKKPKIRNEKLKYKPTSRPLKEQQQQHHHRVQSMI